MTTTIDKPVMPSALIMAFLQYRNTDRNRNRKRLSEETKLKISKANKGKRLGSVPWNKGKKLHYITGKREHSEQTKQKMSIAAKLRWKPNA
jgi:NUMOD3 motif